MGKNNNEHVQSKAVPGFKYENTELDAYVTSEKTESDTQNRVTTNDELSPFSTAFRALYKKVYKREYHKKGWQDQLFVVCNIIFMILFTVITLYPRLL